MLILGQKSCFLGPTIFEIPQPTAKRKLERLQLHHHLSKFEVPVVVNLKLTFEFFLALYRFLFDLKTIGVN